MIFSREVFAERQVAVLFGKRLEPRLQRLQFLQGVQVDVSQGVDLVAQLFDLLLDLLPLPLLFAAGLVLQFGQFDAVVLAHAGGKGLALQADLAGGQVPGMKLLLDLAAPRSAPLGLGIQLASLLLQDFAPLHGANGLRGEGLLAKVQVGKLRLGPQDVPPRGLGPLNAKLELLPALLDRAAALLAVLVALPQAQSQAPQALLALGQLDLGFRGLAIADLPLAFQAGDLLLEAGDAGIHFGQCGFVTLAFLAGLRQSSHRGVVLHRGGAAFPVQRRPLLLELGLAFLRGGEFHPLLGQGVGRLALGGGVVPDRLLPLADPALHLVDRGLGGGDPGVEIDQLLVQLPQLAAAGNQPAGAGVSACRSRTDDQGAVALAEIAGQRDEVQGAAAGRGQRQGVLQFLDDPGLTQQTSGQRRILRQGLHKPIGAADDARLASKVRLAVAGSPARAPCTNGRRHSA